MFPTRVGQLRSRYPLRCTPRRRRPARPAPNCAIVPGPARLWLGHRQGDRAGFVPGPQPRSGMPPDCGATDDGVSKRGRVRRQSVGKPRRGSADDAPCARGSTSMTSIDVQTATALATLARFSAALERRDVDGLIGEMTDDVVPESPGPAPDGERYEGPRRCVSSSLASMKPIQPPGLMKRRCSRPAIGA